MELNHEEERMIAWLRRQHQNWRSTRMIILASSLCLVGLSGWSWWRGETIWHYLPLLIVAIYGLSYTLGSWSGRAEISLLLKLVEQSNKK